MHTLMDAFFDGKKAALKAQVNTFVDGLFDQLKSQVVELINAADKRQCEFPNKDVSIGVVSGTSTKSQLSSVNCKQNPLTPLATTQPNLVPSFLNIPTTSRLSKKSIKSPNSKCNFLAVKSVPGNSSNQSSAKRPLEHVASDYIHQDISDSFANDIGQSPPLIHSKKPKIESTEPNNHDISNSSVDENANFEAQEHDSNRDKDFTPKTSSSLGKFICNFENCNKRFGRDSLLKRHQRTHSGTKPFHCKFPRCSYASATKDHTLRHIRSTHLKPKPDKEQQGQEMIQPQDPKEYLGVDQELLK